jgi:hypothetical protein
MAKSKTVELKVDFHSSGDYTLKSRQGAKGAFTDLKGPFFCNDDKGEFYRAVARKIARLAAEGKRITYSDTQADAPRRMRARSI